MKTKYEIKAEQIIESAKSALNGGRVNSEIDATGCSEIGKHVLGQVSNFSFSAKTEAKSILSEGYSEFTAILSKLQFGSAEYKLASDAQDSIATAAESMGFEI